MAGARWQLIIRLFFIAGDVKKTCMTCREIDFRRIYPPLSAAGDQIMAPLTIMIRAMTQRVRLPEAVRCFMNSKASQEFTALGQGHSTALPSFCILPAISSKRFINNPAPK